MDHLKSLFGAGFRLLIKIIPETHVDLMMTIAGKRYDFECKYTDAPGRTRSMHIAIEDLGLEHMWLIYPGDQKCVLDDKITVIPLEEISQLAEIGITT
ncbi:MAG: hypothetical protein JRI71_12750 [Deltaproteobacteria bacterium]|nr:hypothetical protein [Deltaproteobacteria bacterium]